MIRFQRKSTIAVSLFFALASTACSSKQPIENQIVEDRKSNCGQDANEVSSAIKIQLIRLKESTSISEAESLGVALGQAYEAHPCEFVDQAIRLEFTDKQIAEIIRILPTKFVDRPCESEKQLQLRMQSLDKTQMSAEQISLIKNLLQSSIIRDSRMCSTFGDREN